MCHYMYTAVLMRQLTFEYRPWSIQPILVNARQVDYLLIGQIFYTKKEKPLPLSVLSSRVTELKA